MRRLKLDILTRIQTQSVRNTKAFLRAQLSLFLWNKKKTDYCSKKKEKKFAFQKLRFMAKVIPNVPTNEENGTLVFHGALFHFERSQLRQWHIIGC